MTEERIKEILYMLQKYFTYSNITMSSADVWGGTTAWGYEITYHPQTQIYLWEDTEDIGGGFNAVASFQLSEMELVAKLREIKE